MKLRDFQELGHQVVFIAGDFTAVIGDTSDKDAERPMLEREAIEKNMATYREQVGKILDLSKIEFRRNSEWLAKLTYREIGEHADIFSVADFIARDNIRRRLETGKRVSLREILYPLMQGYDSVAIKADVELGGTDQRFNVLAGRPLQEHFGQPPQHCLLFSLVVDPSGKKMSSSWGNTVNVTDSPEEMFGKVMAIPDTLVEQYFISMTRTPLAEVRALLVGHPKEAKMSLAEEVVRMYHGDEAGAKARKNFNAAFSEGKEPENVQEIPLVGGIRSSMVGARVVASNSEFARLAEQGAIRVVGTDEKITDPMAEPVGEVIRIGKHRFVKMVKK